MPWRVNEESFVVPVLIFSMPWHGLLNDAWQDFRQVSTLQWQPSHCWFLSLAHYFAFCMLVTLFWSGFHVLCCSIGCKRQGRQIWLDFCLLNNWIFWLQIIRMIRCYVPFPVGMWNIHECQRQNSTVFWYLELKVLGFGVHQPCRTSEIQASMSVVWRACAPSVADAPYQDDKKLTNV